MGDLAPGLVARQEYIDAHDDNQHDALDRRAPRKLSFMRLMTRFTRRDWKPVPGQYYALDVNDEGYSIAVVSCLCGSTPRVELLAVATKCDGCDRYFYFGGDRLLSIRAQDGDAHPEAT